MKKNVVYSFSISFAQITSIHNDDLSLPEIIRCKNLFKGCRSREESLPRRSLSPPHTLPRKMTTLTTDQRAEIGLHTTKTGHFPAVSKQRILASAKDSLVPRTATSAPVNILPAEHVVSNCADKAAAEGYGSSDRNFLPGDSFGLFNLRGTLLKLKEEVSACLERVVGLFGRVLHFVSVMSNRQ
jgi:hypothetical protein